MGFHSLTFLALIIKLKSNLLWCSGKFLSFPQSSTQGRGEGKHNLIRFLLSFCAQEMALIFRLALPKAAQSYRFVKTETFDSR